MPELRVLEAGESAADQANNIVLTEAAKPGGVREYTVTVTIDGKRLSTAGPFQSCEEAITLAADEPAHYALHPIYLRRETPEPVYIERCRGS